MNFYFLINFLFFRPLPIKKATFGRALKLYKWLTGVTEDGLVWFKMKTFGYNYSPYIYDVKKIEMLH
jgi:hypothetical protein